MTSSPSPAVVAAQQRILSSLALAGQEAVPFAALQRDLSLDQRTAAEALRGLMEGGKLVLRRGGADGSVFVALTSTMPEGAALVLDAIRGSGNSGIDQATLCTKVRLPKSEILKALHMLVAQKRIKERRCFSNRAKRIYLLFEFEPSDEVTGGTFYGGEDAREMDVSFVDEMRRRIVALVAQRHSVSLEQIVQYLQEANSGSSNNTNSDTLDGKDSTNVVVLTALPNGSTIPSGINSNNNINSSGGGGSNKRVSPRDTQLLVQTLVLDGILDCVTPSITAPAQYQLAIGRNVMRHFTAMPMMGSGIHNNNTNNNNNGTRLSGGGAATQFDDCNNIAPLPHGELISGGLWNVAPVAQVNAWAMSAVGLPCLGCAQLPVCSANGIGLVNPRSCAYMNEWLS